MKTKLKACFLPRTYLQNNYSLLHLLTQATRSVDLQEPEKQTIMRYLGGLDPKYALVVELQTFTTFDDICVLAHKVE